jgi:hypothetical protein
LIALSDTHIGKWTNYFNKKVFLERIASITDKILEEITLPEDLTEIVVALVGDMLEGENIYETQAHHIEMPVIDQVKIATGDGAGVFSAALAGLKPRTNYRFRLFARNMVDTNYSEVYSFFSAPNLPSLSAAVVVDSSRWDSLVVSSSLITNGSESIFDRGFVIAKTNNPFINTKAGEINFVSVDSDSSLNGFQNTIRNLQPSTKYFIRPYARNRGGVGYGVQVAIRTKP